MKANHPINRSEDYPIGNQPLVQHHAKLQQHGLTISPNAWVDRADLALLNAEGPTTLCDSQGQPIAWYGAKPLTNAANCLQAKRSFLLVHSWDFLNANERYVSALERNEIQGKVHPYAVIDGIVSIGRGTRLLPGVVIEGNVIIGENCKIGPNCYLRGATAIGDGCHIGNAVEIKNSIIQANTNIGHLSYVGDSLVGTNVNLGAGTICANFRHDGNNHRSMVDKKLIDTGRRKFGCIIGDRVHTGINTSIYPGRRLYPDCTTRPGQIVQRDLL